MLSIQPVDDNPTRLFRTDQVEDWLITDFNESHGYRSSDGLQLDSESLMFRAENLGGTVDGTVIGVRFHKEGILRESVPLTDKMENYYKNLLNIITEWTDGCIQFVDVNDPRYQHRISQNLFTFYDLYYNDVAYAAQGTKFNGCSIGLPYWGRVSDHVTLHEIFHCLGRVLILLEINRLQLKLNN